MKKVTAILLFTCLIFACKYQPADTGADVKGKLKKAMADFLLKQTHNDSSTVKFQVLDVTYYEAHIGYNCEFIVRMRERNLDTTGKMLADISKDFVTVKRKY